MDFSVYYYHRLRPIVVLWVGEIRSVRAAEARPTSERDDDQVFLWVGSAPIHLREGEAWSRWAGIRLAATPQGLHGHPLGPYLDPTTKRHDLTLFAGNA